MGRCGGGTEEDGEAKKKKKEKREGKPRGIGNNPATRRYRERLCSPRWMVCITMVGGTRISSDPIIPRKKKISMRKRKRKKLAVDNRATLHSSTRRRLRRVEEEYRV